MDRKALYSIILAIVVIGGIGIGVALYHPAPANTATAPSGAYNLELVIVPGLDYNASDPHQPAYFVYHDGVLQSSAYIAIPSHRLINLTILDYDSGPGDGTPSQYLNVSGTVGNVVYGLNASTVNATLASGSNNITINQNALPIHHMAIADIAHTFTVLGLFGTGSNLNVPIGSLMFEFTQFYANTTGSHPWQCMVPCGPGAMATPGWMMGTVVVS